MITVIETETSKRGNMNEIEKRNKYLNYYAQQTKTFDLNEFMTTDNTKINNGAIFLITPNQIVFTKNLPKHGAEPGSGFHEDTVDMLNYALYDLSLSDEELEKTNRTNKYLKEEQNIIFRMINEFGVRYSVKGIFVDYPPTITKNQLDFLEYIEQIYGNLLKRISNDLMNEGKGPLIVFKTKENDDIFCTSIDTFIEYAEQNLLVDNKKIIQENHIIGTTMENINNKDKQI